MASTFEVLSAIDMTAKHKKKNNLTYLPWSSAWAAIKQIDPGASHSPVKTEDGCLYHTDGRTCWVETSLTINGETQNETLAIMNHKNEAIPLDQVTSVNVNKSLKRCLVKNAALFGLDLNLWEGEELSDAAKKEKDKQEKKNEKDAKALSDAIKAVSDKGTELIRAGVSKEDVRAAVAACNDGDGSPRAIPSVEVAQQVIAALEKLSPAKSEQKSEPQKKTAAKKGAKQ